jgi:hypothetical protein
MWWVYSRTVSLSRRPTEKVTGIGGGHTRGAVKYGETHSVIRDFVKETEDHSCVWPGSSLHKTFGVRLCYSSGRLRYGVLKICIGTWSQTRFCRRIEHIVHWIQFSIILCYSGRAICDFLYKMQKLNKILWFNISCAVWSQMHMLVLKTF